MRNPLLHPIFVYLWSVMQKEFTDLLFDFEVWSDMVNSDNERDSVLFSLPKLT